MWPFRSKREKVHRFDTNTNRAVVCGAIGAFFDTLRRKTNPNTAPAGRSKAMGDYGEALAKKHLRRAKLKILATNYRCPAGAVDIIALDRRTQPDTIVFVEVKTRTSDRYTSPAGAVDAEKQRRIRNVANYYLRHKQAGDFLTRYDIVSIVIPDTGEPRIEHVVDAF